MSAKNERELEKLTSRWKKDVFAFCKTFLGEGAAAEEATCEAFAALYREHGLPIGDGDVFGRLLGLALRAMEKHRNVSSQISVAAGERTSAITPYGTRRCHHAESVAHGVAVHKRGDSPIASPGPQNLGTRNFSTQRTAAKILARRYMKVRVAVPALWLAMSLPHFLVGQTQSLTLDQAFERARIRAPSIVAARDRIEEARGRLLGARVLLRDNPVLEFSGGPRYTAGSDLLDAEVGLSQSFELGNRRKSRIAAAEADVERETASSQNVVRELLRDVATAFWQSAAAAERVRVAQKADAVADEFLQNMQRRYEAGDIPVLDVNVARTAAARTRAEVRASEAEQTRALGDLKILLGMRSEEPVSVQADLAVPKQYDLDQLTTEAFKRPDLQAIAAELREAEAEIQLGRGFSWPDLGLGFRYGRDEGDKIAKGGLTLSLPVFSRGQELRATGTARATRLRREMDATRLAIANEVKTAFEVHRRKVEAADELRRNAVQALDENESLARRSFEEGEINVLDLLVIRRDAFETRLIYVNQLLEAELASVDLEARAGVLK